ncbi:DUF4350 domain-containing protein [Gordonia sinesedis]
MTAPAVPGPTASAPPGGPTPPSSAPRSRLRRRVLWSVAVIVAVLALVVGAFALAAAVNGRGQTTTVSLDPQNPEADGTRALARVLDDHGATVTIARGLDALRDEPRPGANTTVVVSRTAAFTPETARAFASRVVNAGRVVLVAPTDSALQDLALPAVAGSTFSPLGGIQAQCEAPGIGPEDTITSDPAGFRALTPGASAVTCFRSGGTVADGANMIVLPADSRRPEYVLVTASLVRNDNLAALDNAGVAVRTIASTDRVLWYLPKVSDRASGPDDTSTSPAILGPLFLLAFFGVVALAIWQGRRFGPLATEPLPAIVKAIETTQSRGRMYHRAKAARRAAAVLRVHTLGRLSSYLGLPYDPGRALRDIHENSPAVGADPAVAAVISATVTATGRDPRQVADLLAGPLPDDDDALLRFTADLTALDKEVRRTP